MATTLYFVGLDVDDKNFHYSVVNSQTGEIISLKCKPICSELVKHLAKIHPDPSVFSICYEAGYLGFSLYRDLKKANFRCDVIAPGLIPHKPSKHLKTDRIDSEKLATYFMKGLLTTIHVPNEESESHRDLLRTRTYLVGHVKSMKNQLLGMFRRWSAEKYKGQNWTKKHRAWLNSQINNLPEFAQISLKTILANIEYMEQTTCYLAEEAERLSETKTYKQKVQSLTCFRGIKTLTAMTIITEIGDFKRFPHPEKLSSYIGLGVREYSSGGKNNRYGITKMGNTFVRTALVEANQYSLKPPIVSRWLQSRRANATPSEIELADRCMKRLYKKANQLQIKNKSTNKIKVACAREMTAFIWEAMIAS